jgi:glycosyltransferase involved in cell wall biosynthesis
MTKVSVIMPAYNSEKYVAEAIQSILSQTFRDFELIIVNDASPDSSDKIIKKFKDKRIRYFRRKYNKGKCHSNNFGIKKARGKYLMIFDSDDIMVKCKIEVLSRILDENPDAGLVYSDALVCDEEGKILGPYSVPLPKKIRMSGKFKDNKFSLKKMLDRDYIPQGSTMFTKKAIKKVGLFDEEFKIAEDWDMWLRISEKFRVVYAPIPTYIYRRRTGSLIHTPERLKLKKKYKKLVLEKRKKRLARG